MKCPICGHELSPMAPRCYNCGHEFRYRTDTEGGSSCLLGFIYFIFSLIFLFLAVRSYFELICE